MEKTDQISHVQEIPQDPEWMESSKNPTFKSDDTLENKVSKIANNVNEICPDNPDLHGRFSYEMVIERLKKNLERCEERDRELNILQDTLCSLVETVKSWDVKYLN
ncbi:uncharacterized protein LOC103514615 isoform X1 [Diaphorina citri]|uniref:Uncharacterized protein LOC103514615 isoform X1 n=1 Tax=Diaphorina citri TaxID=121845 RepID=A0A1S3DA95_DIACI|nr:uncharacterized protein LOC103514615 isoform X1 [Diaphorina citri]